MSVPSHENLMLFQWRTTLESWLRCSVGKYKIKANYAGFENGGTGHQGVPPFSCLFSPWNNKMNLLGGPAAALAEVSGSPTAGKGIHTGSMAVLWCLWILKTSGMPLGKNGWVGGLPALTARVQFQSQGYEGRKMRVGRMTGLTRSPSISISIQNSTIIWRFRQFKCY